MGSIPEDERRKPVGFYIEDALILVSIGLLFVLTVWFRYETWGRFALLAVLLVMAVVFVRRLRRTHRALKGKDGDTEK